MCNEPLGRRAADALAPAVALIKLIKVLCLAIGSMAGPMTVLAMNVAGVMLAVVMNVMGLMKAVVMGLMKTIIIAY
jgi:hypothetical protein